jgi:hypothetical protein
MLYQMVDSQHRIIAFASRALTKSEINYCTSKKEALAAIWACEKWQHYVDCSRFYLVSDHSALQYMFSKSPPTGQNARWILRLQSFDFEFIHKPGKENIVPDVLSRHPLPLGSEQRAIETLEEVESYTCVFLATPSTPPVQKEKASERVGSNKNQPWILKRPDILQLEQEGDEEVQAIVKNLQKYGEKYILKDKILYADSPTGHVPFLPKRLRPLFLNMCHDNVLSVEMPKNQVFFKVVLKPRFKTVFLRKKRFFWEPLKYTILRVK